MYRFIDTLLLFRFYLSHLIPLCDSLDSLRENCHSERHASHCSYLNIYDLLSPSSLLVSYTWLFVDLFWDKLEYDGLRRATSTPALKQSPRHNVKASRRSSASRRKLARALEIASRIAEQLEANTGNLLRTVEEYRRRIQATSGK